MTKKLSTNPKIKFSHRYDKMPPDTLLYSTVLLHVFVIDASDIGLGFRNYDVTYFENGELGAYELPKGKVLVLLLLSGGLILWTTIRRYIPYKYEYYKSLIGREIDIEIKNTT